MRPAPVSVGAPRPPGRLAWRAATWGALLPLAPQVSLRAVKSPSQQRFWHVRTNKAIAATRSATALRRLLKALAAEKRPLNGVNLATIFHKAAREPEVFSADVLDFLIEQLQETSLDLRQLGSCLYGLQRLEPPPRLVGLLAAQAERLALRVDGSEWTAQGVGNAIYGLQGLSNGSEEVRRLLRALAKLLPRTAKLSAQGLGALYGLQGMSSGAESCDELSELLRALRDMVERAEVDGQGIDNALYGLQGMSSDVLEVRELLEALVGRAKTFRGEFTEQEASNALYGLQFMDPELSSVQEILEVLSRRTGHGGAASPRPRRSRHPTNPLEASPKGFVAGAWRPERFAVGPVLLDVGCDMGGFARAVARRGRKVVALELRAAAVAFARARAQREGLEDVIFLHGNANVDLELILKDLQHQVEVVTMNFPDPHLALEHRKRRLVSGHLVLILARYLDPGAQVLFQSDVELLAVEAETAFGHGGCFERRPWLQHFEATEREKVVRQLGRPIYKVCLERSGRAIPDSLERDVDRLLDGLRGT